MFNKEEFNKLEQSLKKHTSFRGKLSINYKKLDIDSKRTLPNSILEDKKIEFDNAQKKLIQDAHEANITKELVKQLGAKIVSTNFIDGAMP